MPDENDEARHNPATGRPDEATPDAPPASGDQIRSSGSDVPRDKRGPDATAVQRPVDDAWAANRANPVWSGRAEVRGPRLGESIYDQDWSDVPVPVRRDRWWMPIVLGVIALVLLGALGWGVYLIAQDSGTPAPVLPVSSPAIQPTRPSIGPLTPAPEPTTTAPISAPSITEPAAEVTVPALRGRTLAEAQAALARTGLKPRVIYRTSDSPPNTVIDSDPAEGQAIPPNTTVTIVVAKAETPAPTAVPTTTAPADDVGDAN